VNSFAKAVDEITGKEHGYRLFPDPSASAAVSEELESLRAKLNELNDEVYFKASSLEISITECGNSAQKCTQLRDSLTEQTAQVNILKSLPSNMSTSGPKIAGRSGEVCLRSMTYFVILTCILVKGLSGLVQRLVQKEKQVLQLQTELERYKSKEHGEDQEEVTTICTCIVYSF
jgi:diaphanous 1